MSDPTRTGHIASYHAQHRTFSSAPTRWPAPIQAKRHSEHVRGSYAPFRSKAFEV